MISRIDRSDARVLANKIAQNIQNTHAVIVKDKIEMCLMDEDMLDEHQLTNMIDGQIKEFFNL